ncbi:Ig-like domain-containing protein [Zavarzinella formosa]|uniref:Ig-like domain-containing protein n=1 Tax=Zavarzinella formosa TaxID=360055 RepID=UPI0002F5A81A|nr:Ig-like domain-containing protein [Zavarzinella formosa]
MKIRPVSLRLCSLEARDVPAAVVYPTATFDDVPAKLPSTWTTWGSNAGQSQIGAQQGLNNSNALVLSGASNAVSRAWDTRVTAANVETHAQVLLNTLIPTQVIARGKSLNTATPTYYAAGIARGVEVTLSKVVNGVSTTLGTLTSNQYLSNVWVDLSLAVQNNRLQVRVQRPDTGQWLNRFGDWQSTPTEALDAVDASIAGTGQVGVNRPASYFGGVTVDNFRSFAATGDITPPTVKFVFPNLPVTAPATGLKSIVKVYTDIVDQGAIKRADFLVDGQLVARKVAGPFRIDLQTLNFANGSHTMSVRVWDASGNTTETTLPVKFNNPPPASLPAIKRHFPSIQYAALAYSGTPMNATTTEMLQNKVDLVVPNPNYLGPINTVAPNTPQMIYSNVSNLYLDLLTDWLNYADAKALPRENAFYHVMQATPFSGNSASSLPVDRFWNVERGNTTLTTYTLPSQQNTPVNIKLGGAGDSLYLAYPDKFREVNVTLGAAATSTAWKGVWEYASSVDANGKPLAWKALKLTTDTTQLFKKTGQLTFDPPTDWKTAVVSGSTARLFYIRFRTTAGTADQAPTVTMLRGRDYVGANGGISGTIPAFDTSADKNGDGYLSDAEYAKRKSGMNARFVYESRLFYPYYGQMRFATNPTGTGVSDWATDYHVRLLKAHPLADGIMMDNSGGKLPNLQASVIEQTDTYTYDYSSMLAQISRAIYPKRIVANTAGGGDAAASVDAQVAGSLEEMALRPLQATWSQFVSVADDIEDRLSKLADGKFIILDTYSTGGGSPTDPRTRMSALAYYYLLADPDSTYLMTWGGEEPASAWDRHWFDAIGYDIGKPTGTWTQTAAGVDPADPRLAYQVFGRTYQNALVLYKPLSYTAGIGTGGIGDNTATTHQLDGNYRILNSDGTLGPVTNKVTLRNGEGVVLIRS